MAIDIELDMRVDPENEVTMSVDDGDEVSFDVGEAIVVKDHAILDNRDLPDQHPISAITGLEDALANIDNMLVVNITSSGGGYVADKTYAEIVEAIPNVVAVHSGSYYPFYRNEPTINPYVTFHGMLLGGEGNTMVIEREINVYQRDSVGVNTVVRPIPSLTSELTNDSGYITVDNVPQELFVVIFFLTGTDPLTVNTTTTAYEVAQAVQSGKALYAVIIAGQLGFANLTPTTLISDNGDVSVGFTFNEQGSNLMGVRYFEIHMLNDAQPIVTNIKTSPFLTGITSSNVTNALGYTPVNPSSLATVATTGSYNDLTDKPTIPTVPVTSVNGRTGAVTGLAEASDLSNYLNKTTGGNVSGLTSFGTEVFFNQTATPSLSYPLTFRNSGTANWQVRKIGDRLNFSTLVSGTPTNINFLNDGSIEAKTQATTDNSTYVATTAFVKSVLPTLEAITTAEIDALFV